MRTWVSVLDNSRQGSQLLLGKFESFLNRLGNSSFTANFATFSILVRIMNELEYFQLNPSPDKCLTTDNKEYSPTADSHCGLGCAPLSACILFVIGSNLSSVAAQYLMTAPNRNLTNLEFNQKCNSITHDNSFSDWGLRVYSLASGNSIWFVQFIPSNAICSLLTGTAEVKWIIN